MAENTDHPGHQSFLARLPISPVEILASALTIGFLLYVNEQLLNHVHEPMFIAPLGASIVILFIVPGMTWARSWAVIGGQVLPSAMALGIVYLLPNSDIVASMLAIALGLVAILIAGYAFYASQHTASVPVAPSAVTTDPTISR